jgi:hypothetical protein
MPTNQDLPAQREPIASENQSTDRSTQLDLPQQDLPAESLEEEKLVGMFERLLIRHEEESGVALTSEQISFALEQQEENRRRSHERMLLREKNRHDYEIARIGDESERRRVNAEIRKARMTFLPRLILWLTAIVLIGVGVILFILVRNDAKDQVSVVLAFVTGLVGGAFAGFGGGVTTARMVPTQTSDKG